MGRTYTGYISELLTNKKLAQHFNLPICSKHVLLTHESSAEYSGQQRYPDTSVGVPAVSF